MVGASIRSTDVRLSAVADGSGTISVPAAGGPNAPLSGSCPPWLSAAATAPSRSTTAVAVAGAGGRHLGASSPDSALESRLLQGSPAAAQGCSVAVGRRALAGGSSQGQGLQLTFVVSINASRTAAVQAALQAQAVRAVDSAALHALLEALATAVGILPAVTGNGAGLTAALFQVAVCSSAVDQAALAAAASPSPSAGAVAAAVVVVSTIFDVTSIGIGAAVGAAAFSALAGAGAAVWLQLRRRREAVTKLRSASGGLRSPNSKRGGSRDATDALAPDASTFQLHHNPSLSVHGGGRGGGVQLRSASGSGQGAGGAPTLRTTAGSVQAAIRTSAAFKGAGASRAAAAAAAQRTASASRRAKAAAAETADASATAGVVHNPLHARLSLMSAAPLAATSDSDSESDSGSDCDQLHRSAARRGRKIRATSSSSSGSDSASEADAAEHSAAASSAWDVPLGAHAQPDHVAVEAASLHVAYEADGGAGKRAALALSASRRTGAAEFAPTALSTAAHT